MKIVVGVPAFNEEKNIAKIIVGIQPITENIIVCDDGSNDLTSQIAEKLGVIVVRHTKNLGYGAAIRSIFLKAKELEADILVTFDADGQHQISDIMKVCQPIIDKEADIIIGTRFSKGNLTEIPKYREFGIKVITKLSNSASRSKVSDSQSGFRAYAKKVFDEIIPSDYGMGVSTEILIKSNSRKFKIGEVPIVISYEGETSTQNATSHGLSVIASTIKFISIENPLKFYGIPGILFFAIGLFFIVWTIQGFTETRQIITNISLIGIGSTLLGILLLTTSIILFSIVSLIRERN